MKAGQSWAVLVLPKGQLKQISGELTNFTAQRLIIRQSQVQAEMDTLNSKGIADAVFSGSQLQNVRKYAIVVTNSKTTTFGTGGKLGVPVGVAGKYGSNENIRLTNGSEMPAPVIQAECIETR
jgi:hypothetical protein